MQVKELEVLEVDIQLVVLAIHDWLEDILLSWGISDNLLVSTKLAIMTLISVVVVYALQRLTQVMLNFILDRSYRLTKIKFFNYATNNKLPLFLALVIPYTFVKAIGPILFKDFQYLIGLFSKFVDIFAVFVIIWTLIALIKSLGNILETKPAFQNKPMKSYIQVIQIVLYIVAIGSIYCIITGRNLGTFFAAMGAASAVLLLMFKDTIMGFVGSIQITTNNMVQIGDWITMSKYGADGDVEEVNLTTVKVRNFDKTITTIPTYALISDSFQNWRGMRDSGGRRLKRAIYVKQLTIRFVEEDELEKYKKIPGLAEFIESKAKAFLQRTQHIEMVAGLASGTHMFTNIDLYIVYCIQYLKNHPDIHQSMTLMVRELAPVSSGLPVEIYTFTNTTIWKEYEMIVVEVMNHLICATQFFGLSVHEELSGSDGYNLVLSDRRRN